MDGFIEHKAHPIFPEADISHTLVALCEIPDPSEWRLSQLKIAALV